MRPSPSISWKTALAALLVFLGLCLAVYSPTFHADFNVDDDLLLLDNPQMRDATGLVRIWTSTDQWDYWPLTYSAYWAQWQLWGANPLPFHLVNIALHAIDAWLLYLLLRRLAIPAAWLGAALFALHPTMVGSVAWIAELKNTFSCLFLLLTTHAYLRYDETASPRAYAASIALFLAALLAKTSTVMLPPALLLLLWWKRGELRRGNAICLWPHFALSLVFGLITIWFSAHRSGAGEKPFDASALDRIAIAGKSFWFYLAQFFAPQPCFQHPRWSASAEAFVDFLPALSVAILFIALFLSRRRWGRPGLLGLGVFFFMLFPVLGFVGTTFFRISFVADHFAYLPWLGLAPLAAAALEKLMERCRLSIAFKPASVVFLGALAVVSWHSSQRFLSREALAKATLVVNPQSWFAHLVLGLVEVRREKLEEAAVHFEEMIRIDPKILEGKNNLGQVRKQQGRTAEAESIWREIAAQDPENATAHYNLGALRMSEGKTGEAIVHFRRAVQAQPIWAKARNQLGDALAQMEKWEEAETVLREALRLNPHNATSHLNLGSVLRAQEKHAASLESFQKAVDLDPNFAQGWWMLSRALVSLGKKNEARWPATQAASLAETQQNMALADEIRRWIGEFLDSDTRQKN